MDRKAALTIKTDKSAVYWRWLKCGLFTNTLNVNKPVFSLWTTELN